MILRGALITIKTQTGSNMVKKTLLSLAIAATAAGLAGCNISSVEKYNDDVDQTPINSGIEGTAENEAAPASPVFSPIRSNLPLATDFLFSGSEDGTLEYPAGEVDIFLADGSRNPSYNPVYDALSDMDGFSTVGQLYIPFSASLEAGELAAGSAYLVPLNYDGGPKLGTLDTSAPFGSAAAIKADVVSYADGNDTDNVLRISPTSPLNNDTRYLVILTNNILDEDGDATKMPAEYEYLIGDEELLSASDSLQKARETMQGWYQLAQGYMAALGQDPTAVTLAYTLTTGGTTEVLGAMTAPGNADAALASPVPGAIQNYLNTTTDDEATQAATVQAMLTAAGSSATAAEVIGAHTLLSALPAPAPRVTDFSESVAVHMSLLQQGADSTFRTGNIELPYYSQAPLGAYSDDGIALDTASDDNYICSSTEAACLQAKASAANVVIGQWQSDEDVIENLQLALGADAATAAAYAAPSENVTNLFPFAQENGKVSAPVLVVEPASDCDNGSTVGKPASGWPVVVFQHGIMGNRMQAVVLAEQFAQACYATVAIDLPMHGLMPNDYVTIASGPAAGAGFPLMALVAESAGGYPAIDGDSDPDSFDDLDAATQALILSGETLKQRHFALTAASDGATPTAVTAANAKSGSLYIDFLHFQTTRDNNRQAVMDLLNLSASLPYMDIDNDGNGTFNSEPDFDASKIYFAGISLGSIVGTQFVALNNISTTDVNSVGNPALNRVQSAVFSVPGGGLPKMLESSATFGSTIVGGLTNPDTFNLTQGGGDYESLMYVYQATVDSADPMNFGGLMQLSQTPYTLIESVGDTVIPNSVDGAPLAGTDPLITAFNAAQVDTSSVIGAADQVAVKLADDYSSHSSFAAPDTDPLTPETEVTFGMLVEHALSRFAGAPVLDDGGAGIVESVPAE